MMVNAAGLLIREILPARWRRLWREHRDVHPGGRRGALQPVL